MLGYKDALEIVLELANQNQIDEIDIAFGDNGLSDQRDWQETALTTLSEALERHGDTIDRYARATAATDWPEESWRPSRDMDPAQLLSALKICLELAETNAYVENQELENEARRQQEAFALTRDLLGLHADAINRDLPRA